MAIVSKIIEQTLVAGATSVTFTDSEITNSLIGLFCSDSDLYPVSRTLTGTTLTVTYEPQSTNKGVALLIVKQGLEIVVNVTSTDDDKALSAKQGKVLKDLIDGFAIPSIEQLTDVDVENLQTDDILIYDAVEEKWINTTLPSIPENINDLSDVDISSPVNGQILTYNNGEWINESVSSGGGVDYSTTEQDTGLKWTDGKTVYQKTLHINSVTSGTSYNHDIANVDQIWIYDIKAKRNIGWFTSGHIFQDGTSNIVESFSVIPSASTVYAYLYGCTITDCDVTLRYTKSS